MPKEILKKKFIFRIKQIFFADEPYDVDGVDYVEFIECRKFVELPGFSWEIFGTLIIDLSKDLDDIYKGMRKTYRSEINSATRQGVKVWINKHYKEFHALYKAFIKRKGLAGSEVNEGFMKEHGVLFTAEYNGEVISGSFFIKDDTVLRWLLGASKRLEVADTKIASLIGKANRKIIWEAIKYAKDIGMKEFDLGGYYIGKEKDVEKEKINFFKEGFGGELRIYYNYYKEYTKLYKYSRKLYKTFKGVAKWVKEIKT